MESSAREYPVGSGAGAATRGHGRSAPLLEQRVNVPEYALWRAVRDVRRGIRGERPGVPAMRGAAGRSSAWRSLRPTAYLTEPDTHDRRFGWKAATPTARRLRG